MAAMRAVVYQVFGGFFRGTRVMCKENHENGAFDICPHVNIMCRGYSVILTHRN